MPAFEFANDPAIARYAENMLIPMASVIRDPTTSPTFATGKPTCGRGGDPGDEKIAAFLNTSAMGWRPPRATRRRSKRSWRLRAT